MNNKRQVKTSINRNLFKQLSRLINHNIKFIMFIISMCFFRSAIADWYTVPTGSMQPTIEIGDRIVVNKMAYDLRLPFSHISLVNINQPQRGDIIVFESDAAKTRLIKRVIGLPGDIISMKNEAIYLNNSPLNYQVLAQNKHAVLLTENLPNLHHTVKYDQSRDKSLASFTNVTVPNDHYLVLGDNRRNSADSRVYGFVPRAEIIGKASHVAFSLDYDNYFLPKKQRFWQSLYQ